MRFTDFKIIDPIMSIIVSIFILISAVKNLKEIIDLFLEKVPKNIETQEIKEHIRKIDGVLDVHHIHIWSLDGENNLATMHIVSDFEPYKIKDKIRTELSEHNIGHITIEIETSKEHCHEKQCQAKFKTHIGHNHNHNH